MPQNTPFFSVGPLTLTDERRRRHAAGQLEPYLTLERNPFGAVQDFGNQLQQPSPDLSPFLNNLKSGVGHIVSDPFDIAESAGEFLGPALDAASDAVFKTQREIDIEKSGQLMGQNVRASAQADRDALKRGQRIEEIRDLLGGEQSYADAGAIIGPAPNANVQALQLPPPPGPVDYSGVYDALDQTRPTLDETGLEERRRGAILAGLLGGLLQASMQDDASFGQVLGGGGLGVLAGMAQSDRARNAAEAKFREAANQYWIRTANVKKSEAESTGDYAQRVYNTKIMQLKLNADAAAQRAKAGQARLLQAGDKFFVEESVNGQRRIRLLDVGMVGRAAGMQRQLTRLLGGTEEAEDKAAAMTAEVLANGDPSYGYGMMVLARLKNNGKYLDLVNILGEQNDEFKKAFNSLGAELQGAVVGDEGQLKAMVSARRDALLLDILLRSDATMIRALDLAGVSEPAIRNLYSGR